MFDFKRFRSDVTTAREAVGLSKTELARRIDVPFQTVWRVEHAYRIKSITTDVLYMIAGELKLDLNQYHQRKDTK